MPNPPPLSALGLFARALVVTLVTSTFATLLMRFSLPSAAIWLSNVVTVLLLIEHKDSPRWAGLLGAFLGIGVANTFAGTPPPIALGFGVANLLEICITTPLLLRYVGPPRWTPGQLLRAVFIGVSAGPLISGVVGSATLHFMIGSPFLPSAIGWYAANAVALALTLPAWWLLHTIKPPRDVAVASSLAMWSLTVLAAALVFSNDLLPLLFIPPVPLAYFAIVGLPRQGVWAMLVVAATAVIATHTGHGPITHLHNVDPMVATLVLQAYLLTLGLVTFPSTMHHIRRSELVDNLTASRASARRSNQAKSRFLATMSHELRTPIAGVLGYVDLLRDTPLRDPQGDYVEHISAGVEHLRLVIGDVLDLSSIEANQLTLRPKPTDLKRLLHSCASIVRGQCGDGVALKLLVAEEVPAWVETDEARLRQVLMNLLNNAAKFTTDGVVLLQVRAEERPSGGVAFTVRDTGCGIPEEEVLRVLERFHQASEDRDRSHSGTGLGLSIARELVRAMGGELKLESVVKLGTTVSFALPLQACPAPRVDGPAGLAASAAPLGLKVLLVEDDPSLNELLTLQLTALGCEVTAFHDPREALTAVHAAEVLVSDLHMPRMHGIELLRRARALRPALPAVLLTADVTPQAAGLATAAGFQAVLTKPATREDLHMVLSELALSAADPSLFGPSAVDKRALAQLKLVIGGEELEAMLGQALVRFDEMIVALSDPALPRAEGRGLAHKLRGSAGSLAMTGLQLRAALLEDALESGEDSAQLLADLVAAMRETERCFDALGEEPSGLHAAPALCLVSDDAVS